MKPPHWPLTVYLQMNVRNLEKKHPESRCLSEEPTQQWLAQQPSCKWRLECYLHTGLCADLMGGPTKGVGTSSKE